MLVRFREWLWRIGRPGRFGVYCACFTTSFVLFTVVILVIKPIHLPPQSDLPIVSCYGMDTIPASSSSYNPRLDKNHDGMEC